MEPLFHFTVGQVPSKYIHGSYMYASRVMLVCRIREVEIKCTCRQDFGPLENADCTRSLVVYGKPFACLFFRTSFPTSQHHRCHHLSPEHHHQRPEYHKQAIFTRLTNLLNGLADVEDTCSVSTDGKGAILSKLQVLMTLNEGVTTRLAVVESAFGRVMPKQTRN